MNFSVRCLAIALLFLPAPSSAFTCMPIRLLVEVPSPEAGWALDFVAKPDRKTLKVAREDATSMTYAVFFDTLRVRPGKAQDCSWEPSSLVVRIRHEDGTVREDQIPFPQGFVRIEGTARSFRATRRASLAEKPPGLSKGPETPRR